ncbi:TIGR01244 family sulfur transferase [Salipiger sp. 1_MG-2023]|uniref:TIGR01244 family sulfur transferase n=1 Tax=Salipiger sp. 1_MG-2023 TaxID=3062665 RepID=UPI0026E36C27|nr:TIGR01244 family sulfur transferase [Salipiger sp. 1_MG-2023]MDO6588200.1 TIGR01244 family sulfur transferase [Salipiger sp. 1_MG-2023]
MTMINVSGDFNVSPQISVEDIPALKAAGITLVICNRPDAEVPPSHQAEAIREAAIAEGMSFAYLPVTPQGATMETVTELSQLLGAPHGPVLAYCRSGTRSTTLWALAEAGRRDTDEIITQANEAGYDLGGMRPTIEALAAQRR